MCFYVQNYDVKRFFFHAVDLFYPKITLFFFIIKKNLALFSQMFRKMFKDGRKSCIKVKFCTKLF